MKDKLRGTVVLLFLCCFLQAQDTGGNGSTLYLDELRFNY